MFVLPQKMVKEVIAGLVDYDSLPCDRENEKAKGFMFEDQARVNLRLRQNHIPVCRALEKECKKETCPLFARKSGKIPDGWVCREFQIDFPEAPFDARCHVSMVGVDRIDWEATIENLEGLRREGANYICLGCRRVYVEKPLEWYEDGHGGRNIKMCSCGSDLFETIYEFIKNLLRK